MSRRTLIAVGVATVLLPVALAASQATGPGYGPGCHRGTDGKFHGYCFHNRRVVVHRISTVRVPRYTTVTSTQTDTEVVSMSGGTTEVGGGRVTSTTTVGGTATVTTTAPPSATVIPTVPGPTSSVTKTVTEITTTTTTTTITTT